MVLRQWDLPDRCRAALHQLTLPNFFQEKNRGSEMIRNLGPSILVRRPDGG